jgi:hypothetical protein
VKLRLFKYSEVIFAVMRLNLYHPGVREYHIMSGYWPDFSLGITVYCPGNEHYKFHCTTGLEASMLSTLAVAIMHCMLIVKISANKASFKC